jgi:predicted dehydrogenase
VTGVIVVGAGNMGRKWLRTVHAHPRTEAVGLVDLDLDRAKEVVAAEGLEGLPVAASLDELAARVQAEAIVDATVPVAHREVTATALRHGYAVLGEKPAAASLAESVALAAFAQSTGGTFVVSQSRRFNPQLTAVRAWLEAGPAVGALSARFSRGPHFGGFREEMASPLVVDMSIHLFDMARMLANRDPVAVYARESNPTWSWYRGDASARAIVEFGDGVDFVFDGTWAGLGADTSWNGDWRVTTDRGTLLWSGDDPAVVQSAAGEPAAVVEPLADAGTGLPGSLSAFLDALETDGPTESEIHDNLLSVAVVEAVLESAATGRRVLIDEILESARAQARAQVEEWEMPEAAEVLDGWTSVTDAIAAVRGR